jgi:transcriptional regulator with XRE-family HTH domain
MLKNQEIMRYLERYRLEQKVPIYQLTKGIMSTRNYSRILSGEVDLSLEDYAKLLNRLRIPLFEFNIYIDNCKFYEYNHEIRFHQAVENHQFNTAYEIIQPYLKEGKWYTLMASKTIPMAIKLMEWKLNQCTVHHFYASARLILDLDGLEKQKILSFDDFEALYLYSYHGSVEEQRRIFEIFYRIMKNELRILSVSLEYSMSRLHQRALQLATGFEDPDERQLKQLHDIAWIVVEYQSRAKIIGVDRMIFEMLSKFYIKHHLSSSTLFTEYALSVLGSLDMDAIAIFKAVFSSSEIDVIKANLLPSRFPNKHFLEELKP